MSEKQNSLLKFFSFLFFFPSFSNKSPKRQFKYQHGTNKILSNNFSESKLRDSFSLHELFKLPFIASEKTY